ncbi:tetratricopeptide repeat protein, partial [Cutibacterium acnes]
LNYSSYFENEIKLIMKQLSRNRVLDYRPVINVPEEKREFYLECRDNAYDYLQLNDFSEAERNIEYAKNIFDKDPELLRIEGDYLIFSYKLDKALVNFNLLLSIEPENIECLFARADILKRQGLVEESIKDYLKIQELSPSSTKLYPLLAECYMKANDLNKAREYYLKGIELNPTDKILKNTLIHVNLDLA